MTDTDSSDIARSRDGSAVSRSRGALSAVALLRAIGWILIAAGAVVGLYVVYSLFFTGVATQSAQGGLSDVWQQEVGSIAPPSGASSDPSGGTPDPSEPEPAQTPPAPPAPVDPGEAVAVIQFFRPGSDQPPVHDEPLFVVEGVTLGVLTKGPGHYPDSALPGQPGNFAVAGHRTTYGAPFMHLDALVPGDEIHVTDRTGASHVYRVVQQQIVKPWDTWVIGADPLGRATSMLTLTTCHPRFSAKERLIVFAELVNRHTA
ncbi:MAG TPA: class E sortase [Egibacteraceae bacterium]|nr:class E sortase [Egibacteraceae bacterium]